jgi:hypothetical protein
MSSKIISYLVQVLQANSLVNTISLRDDDVIDTEKSNVYPLVAMRLLTSTKEENRVLTKISFQIRILRDFIPKSQPSKLMTDTNYIDNIAICDSIGNDLILHFLKVDNDFNIFIDTYTDFEYTTNLDGVNFTVDFVTAQNGI